MTEPVARFQNEARTAEVYWLENSQDYVVRLHNDLGHDFKAYFHKDDLERAKSYARGWVDEV